jgi:hypothetical protein
MISKEESECQVWWHAGLNAWAWLCWRCRTPGAGWSGQEKSWRGALDAAEQHVRAEHSSVIQPDLPPPVAREAAGAVAESSG